MTTGSNIARRSPMPSSGNVAIEEDRHRGFSKAVLRDERKPSDVAPSRSTSAGVSEITCNLNVRWPT